MLTKKSGILEIADKVTIIEDYAFCNCIGVESFNFPDTVSEISLGAFENVDKERIAISKS